MKESFHGHGRYLALAGAPVVAIAALAVVAVSASIVGARWMLRSHSGGRGGRHPPQHHRLRIVLRGTGRRPADTYAVSAALYKFRDRRPFDWPQAIEWCPAIRSRSIQSSRPVRPRRQRRRARRVAPAFRARSRAIRWQPTATRAARSAGWPGDAVASDKCGRARTLRGLFASPSQMSIFDELLSCCRVLSPADPFPGRWCRRAWSAAYAVSAAWCLVLSHRCRQTRASCSRWQILWAKNPKRSAACGFGRCGSRTQLNDSQRDRRHSGRGPNRGLRT